MTLPRLHPIGRTEVLGDQPERFGAVLSSIHLSGPREARLLRDILVMAALHRTAESASIIGKWIDDIDSAFRRAAAEHWPGWESVHASGNLPLHQGSTP